MKAQARKSQPLDDRAKLSRAIHAEKRRHKMEDADYRSAIKAVTGKRSSKDCTAGELRALLRVIRGEAPADRASPARQAEGAIPRKVRALVLSLWNLGAWHDDITDGALRKFIRRQAELDDLRFLTPDRASSVIEALRAMCERAGFKVPPDVKPDRARRLLIKAQFARLEALDAAAAEPFAWVRNGFEDVSEANLHRAIYSMGREIRAHGASQGEAA